MYIENWIIIFNRVAILNPEKALNGALGLAVSSLILVIFYCSDWHIDSRFLHLDCIKRDQRRSVSAEEIEIFDHWCCSAVLTDMFKQDHREIERKGPTATPPEGVQSTDWSFEVFCKIKSLNHMIVLKLFHVSTRAEEN